MLNLYMWKLSRSQVYQASLLFGSRVISALAFTNTGLVLHGPRRWYTTDNGYLLHRDSKVSLADYIHESTFDPSKGYYSRLWTGSTNNLSHSVHVLRKEGHKCSKEFDPFLHGIPIPQKALNIYEKQRSLFSESISNYLVLQYKLRYFPVFDLKIYDFHSGTGIIALDILDYLYKNHLEVYGRTTYNIVLHNSWQASWFKSMLTSERYAKHGDHIDIYVSDPLTWNHTDTNPCFVLALQVISSFGHDLFRQSNGAMMMERCWLGPEHFLNEFFTLNTHQKVSSLNYHLAFQQARINVQQGFSDSRAKRYFSGVKQVFWSFFSTQKLTYYPTKAIRFFERLSKQFPHHSLLLMDVCHVDKSLPGINAPSVLSMENGFSTKKMSSNIGHVFQNETVKYVFPTPLYLVSDILQLATHNRSFICSLPHFLRRWSNEHGRKFFVPVEPSSKNLKVPYSFNNYYVVSSMPTYYY